jgi:hypothetical protein
MTTKMTCTHFEGSSALSIAIPRGYVFYWILRPKKGIVVPRALFRGVPRALGKQAFFKIVNTAKTGSRDPVDSVRLDPSFSFIYFSLINIGKVNDTRSHSDTGPLVGPRIRRPV